MRPPFAQKGGLSLESEDPEPLPARSLKQALRHHRRAGEALPVRSMSLELQAAGGVPRRTPGRFPPRKPTRRKAATTGRENRFSVVPLRSARPERGQPDQTRPEEQDRRRL